MFSASVKLSTVVVHRDSVSLLDSINVKFLITFMLLRMLLFRKRYT